MNTLKIGTLLLTLTVLTLTQVNAAPGKGSGGKSKDPLNVEAALASVPAPELPAKAAELILDAKPKDREAIALTAVRFTASEHPGSIAPLVSSVARAHPEGAAAVAALAVKLVPDESSYISRAAVSAAPKFSDQITRAVDEVLGESKPEDHPSKKDGDQGHRPEVPPGHADGKKQNSIRGNRPDIPPGHVRDPKPGRDPQRHNYARP